jgi:hypothetical protein
MCHFEQRLANGGPQRRNLPANNNAAMTFRRDSITTQKPATQPPFAQDFSKIFKNGQDFVAELVRQ